MARYIPAIVHTWFPGQTDHEYAVMTDVAISVLDAAKARGKGIPCDVAIRWTHDGQPVVTMTQVDVGAPIKGETA